MFNQLEKHSKIEGTSPKETFFLTDSDSPFHRKERNFHWHDFLSHVTGEPQYILEGTTHTIFQHTAPTFFEGHPNVKLLVIVRNPALRIFSSFNFSKYNLNVIDKSVDFSKYVDDLVNNRNLHYVKNRISQYVLSRELTYSDYNSILRPWKPLYKSDKLKIVLFETLVKNPEKFYTEIFEWLGLPLENVWESVESNVTRKPHYPALHKMMVGINKLVYNWKVVRPMKFYYKKMFTEKSKWTEKDKESIDFLAERFRESSRQFSNEYNIDIAHWNCE